MNLTDFEQTSIELVFETVCREARRYGVEVAGSEIVGLIPQRALEQAVEFYLRVENFKPELILENRLSEVMSAADGLRGFIQRVASAEPVPGGGSVAALAGALGAALGQMAIRLTKDKRNFEQHAARYSDSLNLLAGHTSTLTDLIDADADAFTRVMSAYKLPKDSPNRETAIQDALVGATEVPSRTATAAAEALQVLEPLRAIIHPNVGSDFQVALDMLRSSIRGAIANMRINLSSIKDPTVRSRYETRITNWEKIL
jgi:formiminotetrahydrofolate cyclodeaminase